MELGLSLGDSSSLKPFADVAQKSTSKVPHLRFHMGLCLLSKSTNHEVEDEDEDNQDVDIEKHSSQDTDKTTPLHLLSTLGGRFPRHSENGSSEGGSLGNMRVTRGVDVNKMMYATEEEVSSATPSLFSSDLGIYRGNVGNKRSLDDHGNEVVVKGERGSNSKASDEDENRLARKKLRLSKQQSAFLEERFKEHSTQSPKQKQALAKQLNLRPRQVEVWFQNRRARTKLKQTEVDCEYLKRYFETLTKENRKLHKELQELRALETSSPLYMQSLATTLTMCPSCHERVATSTPSSTTAIVIAAKPTTAASLAPLPFPLSRSNSYSFKHAPTKAS